MLTPFSKIRESFITSITDNDLADMAKEEVDEDLIKYMKKFISLDFKVSKKNLLKYFDDTLQHFTIELEEEEINLIGMGIIPYWLQPKILHEDKLKQNLGDRDYKVTHSGGNLLDKLIKLDKEVKMEINSYVRAYSYNDFAYKRDDD